MRRVERGLLSWSWLETGDFSVHGCPLDSSPWQRSEAHAERGEDCEQMAATAVIRGEGETWRRLSRHGERPRPQSIIRARRLQSPRKPSGAGRAPATAAGAVARSKSRLFQRYECPDGRKAVHWNKTRKAPWRGSARSSAVAKRKIGRNPPQSARSLPSASSSDHLRFGGGVPWGIRPSTIGQWIGEDCPQMTQMDADPNGTRLRADVLRIRPESDRTKRPRTSGPIP